MSGSHGEPIIESRVRACGMTLHGRRPVHRVPGILDRALAFAASLLLAVSLAASAALAAPMEELAIRSGTGLHVFRVEIADTPEARATGLMFRREMAADAGMLFEFHALEPVAFWMKNTELPLDMLFIDRGGRIVRIHERAEPGSLDVIESRVPVWAVLELNGGTAERLGIRVGDRVRHPAFSDDE